MTREEAIKELEILKQDYWDDDGYGHETKQYDDTMLALDMAIEALNQRWIPVTERLPEVEEEATRCLVTVDVCGSFDDYTAIRTYFSDTKDFNDVVTAWMPLPKPYNAESEGKE